MNHRLTPIAATMFAAVAAPLAMQPAFAQTAANAALPEITVKESAGSSIKAEAASSTKFTLAIVWLRINIVLRSLGVACRVPDMQCWTEIVFHLYCSDISLSLSEVAIRQSVEIVAIDVVRAAITIPECVGASSRERIIVRNAGVRQIIRLQMVVAQCDARR